MGFILPPPPLNAFSVNVVGYARDLGVNELSTLTSKQLAWSLPRSPACSQREGRYFCFTTTLKTVFDIRTEPINSAWQSCQRFLSVYMANTEASMIYIVQS